MLLISLVVITLSDSTDLLGLILGVTVLLEVCLQRQSATYTERKALMHQVLGYLREASASDVWATASFSAILHMHSITCLTFCIHLWDFVIHHFFSD